MKSQYSIAVAATGTDFHTHPDAPVTRGWIGTIEAIIPNFTNDVTTTITIERLNGLVVYQSAALARNTKTEILVDRWVDPFDIIRLTLSGAAGGTGGTASITLIMR